MRRRPCRYEGFGFASIRGIAARARERCDYSASEVYNEKENSHRYGVCILVVLSGTTALYLLGLERSGVTSALGQVGPPPPSSDCTDAGGFCAIDLGMTGGCTARDCCPPGDNWCPGWEYRRPNAFQEVASPTPPANGSCWWYPGNTAPYCTEKWCDGNGVYVCSVYCQPQSGLGEVRVLFRQPPQALNASCDLEAY